MGRELGERRDDPYAREERLADDTVCPRCTAITRQGLWYFDPERAEVLLAAGEPTTVLCPACRKIEEQVPQGVLTLHGGYLAAHRDEILNLIRNEESRALEVNPMERIMTLSWGGDEQLRVETTTPKLAQRLGRAVHHAHRGSVRYQWGGRESLARVYWEREE
jgi:hypothetical protein